LLKEINSALRGAYVNNIYTAGPSQLFRLRRPDEEDRWLVVSPRKGVWVSREVKERAETGEFTSRLRGELERAKFVESTQVDLDRVFVLEFEARERKSLVVEMMPPGNVIVTDEGRRIILAQNEVRSQARYVVKGSNYPPPKQSRLSPADIDENAVREMLGQEDSIGKAIGKHVALPRKYVAECLARLGVADGSPSQSLSGREGDVVRTMQEMVKEAREDPRPCIVETPQGDELFVIQPRVSKVKETAGSVSELCDKLLLSDALSSPEPQTPEEAKRKELEVTVSRLRADSEANLAEAAKAREAAAKVRSAPLSEGLKLLDESGIRTAREPTSAAAVASALFDHAKALEAKSEEALESAKDLEKRMPRVRKAAASRGKLLPRRKAEWYEKFRWFQTTNGKLAIGGRDAQSNSTLISRHLEPYDTVYHADLFGSPFFVLKGGEEQTEEEIRQVSQATVAFSSAWKTGLGSADAYWIVSDQVSPAAPSGEYLARGSFAIRGKKNFVAKNMVEVAVGVDTAGRVLAGPEEAIRTRSARYVVLRPHKEKSSDTAKQVLKELSTGGPVANPLSLDEVLRSLPAGGGKVIRRAAGTV